MSLSVNCFQEINLTCDSLSAGTINRGIRRAVEAHSLQLPCSQLHCNSSRLYSQGGRKSYQRGMTWQRGIRFLFSPLWALSLFLAFALGQFFSYSSIAIVYAPHKPLGCCFTARSVAAACSCFTYLLTPKAPFLFVHLLLLPYFFLPFSYLDYYICG